jgi:hypothetical protein
MKHDAVSDQFDIASENTQLLRESVNNPDLRITMTVNESYYRVVSRRSAGITKLISLPKKSAGVGQRRNFRLRSFRTCSMSSRRKRQM